MPDHSPQDAAPLPICYRCRHFHRTYRFPLSYGCRAYGFLSQRLPSHVVFDSSGGRCMLRKPLPEDEVPVAENHGADPPDGWLA